MRNNTIFRDIIVVSIFFPLFMFIACNGSYRSNVTLYRIDEELSDSEVSTGRALAFLDSLSDIPEDELSNRERHYRDFLSIKAADKGYKLHTSDSLFLTVKEYFSSNHREILPEVSYYGGRVYSDLGNYPVALQYFEESLDCLGENTKDIKLKLNVLSQTGRLLCKLRLYDEALCYVEKCIELSSKDADTLMRVYDFELAGGIATRIKNLKKARIYFENACKLSKVRYPEEHAINRFRMAHIMELQGDLKGALQIMRSTIDSVTGMSRNYALPIIAQAYLSAGNLDSAYMYANELINNRDTLNKKFGYKILLSERMRGRFDPETLSEYLFKYDDILVRGLEDSMSEAVIMQNALYNYSIHDRERQRMEKERNNLKRWLITILISFFVFGFIIIWRAFKKEKTINKIFQLRARRIFIKYLFSASNEAGSNESKIENPVVEEEELLAETTSPDYELKESREKLIGEVLRLCEGKDKENFLLPNNLIMSNAFVEICNKIKNGSSIGDNETLWEELAKSVSECFPEFFKRLRLLTNGKLSKAEEHTALLVKCGFGVTDMAIALGRSKGAIVSRRESISKKIFDEKKGSKEIDRLIRSL